MKALALILLIGVCYVECRKIVPPINKYANADFINMESGGMRPKPAVVEPPKPGPAVPAPSTKAPTPVPVAKPAVTPSPTVTKPVVPPSPTSAPVVPQPQKPAQPTHVKPAPTKPASAGSPNTTPLPGSVKALVNYYDSKGNASPIRPYSYSQAVKQGKK